jgi:hypothetical protein
MLAAPVGPGGSWQIVETNVVKTCPAGSSCRKVCLFFKIMLQMVFSKYFFREHVIVMM